MEGIECSGCVAHVANSDDRTKLLNFTLERYNFNYLIKKIF